MNFSAIDTNRDYYPVPFQKNAPTVPLAKISISKLIEGDEYRWRFLLDLTTEPRGQGLLEEADQLHNVAKNVLEKVSMDQKSAFQASDLTGSLDSG